MLVFILQKVDKFLVSRILVAPVQGMHIADKRRVGIVEVNVPFIVRFSPDLNFLFCRLLLLNFGNFFEGHLNDLL